jgi:hypothetical protein
VKWPAVSSRPVTIFLRLSIGALWFGYLCTLTVDSFFLLPPKTVRSIAIFIFILGWFVYFFHLMTSTHSPSHTPVLNTSEVRQDIQKIFTGVNIDIDLSNANGYRESRWPGEYVSYYRFYAPSQDIDNVLNRFMFKKTKYKSNLKFKKMNRQPDWWNPSELTQANIYSNEKRWLIYDKSMGLAYLYSSSGEFGIAE